MRIGDKYVIAITGYAGSGKDTVAAALVDRFGFALIRWADPLKDLCAEQFGWDREMLDSSDPEVRAIKEAQDLNLPDGWTPRRVLQFIGTECFRHIDPEYWTKKCVERAVSLLSHPEIPGVVIPDTRFLNEALQARSFQSSVVLRVKLAGQGNSSRHASEVEIDLIDPDRTVEAVFGDLDGLIGISFAALRDYGVDLSVEAVG